MWQALGWDPAPTSPTPAKNLRLQDLIDKIRTRCVRKSELHFYKANCVVRGSTGCTEVSHLHAGWICGTARHKSEDWVRTGCRDVIYDNWIDAELPDARLGSPGRDARPRSSMTDERSDRSFAFCATRRLGAGRLNGKTRLSCSYVFLCHEFWIGGPRRIS